MRIIAGEFRGRRLLGPEGDATRPITDRAKQSLFDVLAPLLPGSVVYDLFAGTGSMGLESISRGARLAVFYESDRSALALLRKNIDALRVADRCRVVAGDLFRLIAASAAPDADRADLVFLDPPYRFVRERPDDLRALATTLRGRHMAPDATLVFRHDAADAMDLPGFERFDLRTYGEMAIELLR